MPLPVYYRDSNNNGISGANLSFAVDTIASVASLQPTVVPTNNLGLGHSNLTVAPVAEGIATVTVQALNDSQAGTLTFKVQLGDLSVDSLIVTVNYAGSTETAFEARLFLQNGTTQTPTCGDVDPANIAAPVSTLSKPGIANQAKATWTNKELPGLLTAGTQLYTVQVVAPGSGQPVKAAGCLDGIPVKKDESREVVIDVNDLPKNFQGDYDIMTTIDMHNNLPGAGGTAIGLIVDLFTDPGALALVKACENASGLIDTLCGLLVSGGTTTALGDLAASKINEAFFGWIDSNLEGDVVVNGQTIALLLKDMRFRSTLTLNGEPAIPVKGTDDTVVRVDFPANTVSEEWEFVGYFWKIGKNCAPTDIECGLEWVKMSDIYGTNPTTTNMTAGVVASTDLEIDVHEVSLLSYGPLVNFLIEKKVLPLIFGKLPNGENVDSFQEVVLGMIGGSNCLLVPAADEVSNCCAVFEANVKPQIDPPFNAFVGPLCNMLVPTLTNALNDAFTDVTGPLSIGTADGIPCPVTDWDDNLWMDHMGSQTAPCTWDAEFDLGSDSFSPDATFYGTRK